MASFSSSSFKVPGFSTTAFDLEGATTPVVSTGDGAFQVNILPKRPSMTMAYKRGGIASQIGSGSININFESGNIN